MHFWVSTAIVTLCVFKVSSVYGALTVSYNGSNEVGSTTYSLICDIPGFATQAVWSKAGKAMSTCFTSGCLVTSSPPYTFRHSTSGIYVDFSVLTENETGIQWTCAHIGDTPVHFIVQVDFDPESDRGGLLVDLNHDKGGLSSGARAGIGVGCSLAVIGVILVVVITVKLKTRNTATDEETHLTDEPKNKSGSYTKQELSNAINLDDEIPNSSNGAIDDKTYLTDTKGHSSKNLNPKQEPGTDKNGKK